VTELVLTAEDGGVATLTLNRPDRLNALDASVLSRLTELVGELEARGVESRPRAVILTGQGEKAFVAGADISSMVGLGASDARRFSELGQRLGRALDEASFAVIAAVNGFALGGGCELALCADLILASDRARFGQPEINLGLIPGFGGTLRLARRVGPGWANRLILTGEPIDATKALEIGLCDAVFPATELIAKAHELAQKIAAKPPLAIAAARRCLLRARTTDPTTATDFESSEFGNLFASADGQEGMRAFVEKRAAVFRGQ
jgi:enoyl-CoA hydratase